MFLVALIILDMIAVSIELFLVHSEYGKRHHSLERAIHWSSIAMLLIFLLESCAQLLASGLISFAKSIPKVATLGVVSLAILLEFSLEEEGQGFVEVLLLERVFRILHATQEAKHGIHSVTGHGHGHAHGHGNDDLYSRFEDPTEVTIDAL